jgi:hypothetical protein
MKKNTPIYIYGVTIIMAGIFLILSMNYTFENLKLAVGISLIFGALLAFSKALTREKKQVEFTYHRIHALTILVYSTAILVFANTTENFIFLSIFLFFFYAFSEVIFCSWLLNLGRKTTYKIIVTRLLLAIVVGLGTVFLMIYPSITFETELSGFGMLFIIIGINILLYVPIMSTKKVA